jgi:hypothetical protein
MPSTPDPARSAGAALAVVRAAWGALLVCCPGPLLRAAAGHPGSGSDRMVLRLLGTRHLLQAAVTTARPSRTVLDAGGVIDLLHAASQVALACSGPRWRRAAALDAAGAAAFAAAGLRAARPARREARSVRQAVGYGRRPLAR